ncbi:MAG: ATP-binding protein [Xanthomonadales bacterium]|nr:ATP-binding protein [Xanthomonadales bacterium]
MLIEFNVANFQALRDSQRFSLVRGKGTELESNVFRTPAPNEFELLRSAAIYGPNASGKTTFIRALEVMKEIVLESATARKAGEELPLAPFLLSGETRDKPSDFEVIFLLDGVRYQYGFSASPRKVHDEWLFAFPRGRAQRWFQRVWDAEQGEYEWYLGDKLEGEKQLWQKSTRDNALYLSTAVNLNAKQLQPIYDWFHNHLRVAGVGGWSPSFSASRCDNGQKQQILEFLRAADLAIRDILVEKTPFDVSKLPDDMPDPVKQALISDLKDSEVFDLKTVHQADDGRSVSFDLEVESAGTQKLFAFAGPWLDALDKGYTLFIDELNNSLHPRLVRFLVELFHDPERNSKNAQLVFTTHETSILNQQVLRRDQVWFCERGKDQAARIYPLTDFRPRKGRENLELAYLSGRYGALPFIGHRKSA